MTRGVLIDVAALKGVETLPDTYEITVQDLQQALSAQGVALGRGDAVLIHTGWGKLWGRKRAVSGRPTLASAWRRRSGWPRKVRCSSVRTRVRSR